MTWVIYGVTGAIKYENLIESTPTVDVFTDFIGLIDHVVDARKQDNAPYIRLYLKDGRNNITATLWKEIIMSDERFNRTTLDNTPRPCTVAITSVKVSKHKGWFQLTSTPATYTYINPACDQSTSLLQRSQFSPQRSMISHNVSSSSSIEKRRLSSLLEIDHHQTPGQIYMCEARISEFIPGVPWFKRYCNIVSCTEKVSPSSNKYFCVTHGLSDTCRYMFMPTTTIADADTSATAVLYDDAAQSVIGQSCSEFVTSLSAADPMVLPEALLTARNAYFTFFLKIKPNTKAGVTTFIIERADPISLTTGSVTPHTPQPITETNRQTSASDVARPLFHDTASPSTEKLKKQRQE